MVTEEIMNRIRAVRDHRAEMERRNERGHPSQVRGLLLRVRRAVELAQQVAEALKDPQQGDGSSPTSGRPCWLPPVRWPTRTRSPRSRGRKSWTPPVSPATMSPSWSVPIWRFLWLTCPSGTSAQTVTLDITPKYIAVAATDPEDIQLDEGGKNAVQMGDPQELTITKPVTITLPLTEGFAEDGRLYVKHEKSSGKVYYYRGQVESNVLTFTNPTASACFTTPPTPM